MNTIFIALISVMLVSFTSLAQVPRTISFQGVLTDAQGNIVSDGNHQLTLKLYDAATNGNILFTETQIVPVVKGVFNAIIGSVQPIPTSLSFDRAYFLGVNVDGGLELSPRIPLTAVPYALRAERATVAESLIPNAGGVVTRLNGQSGDLNLVGGGTTTVSQSGNNIQIFSTGSTGGTGISGVQNNDGTIAVQNPTGPVATIGIPDGALSAQKINPTGAMPGQALVYNGSNVGWQTVGGGGIQGVENTDNTLDVSNPNGPTATINVKDQGITSGKIATGQVVKSINTLKDDVTLEAGSNVTITPSGNKLTISASGGSGGSNYWTANGANISNSNSDNVGIGTTDPINRLHVEGAGITLSRNGFGNPFSIVKDGNTPFAVFEGGSVNQYRFAINNSGNVGIGTTDPGYKLDVIGGDVRTDGVLRFNEAGYPTQRQHFISHSHSLGSDANNWLSFNISNGAGINGEIMRMNGAGSVGIGTSSPFGKLHVGSSNPFVISNTGRVGINVTTPYGQLHIRTNGSSMSEGVVIDNPNPGGQILSMHQGVPGRLNFSTLWGSAPIPDLVTMDFTNGRVGINNPSPTYRLEVGGNMNVNGIVYAFGVPLPSDIRLKRDIKPITHAIEMIQSIRGVHYMWRTDEFPQMTLPEERQIGVIAQEVEKLLPEVISEKKDGYKAVDYTKIVPVLIEAVKEQQQQIANLQTLVDQLRKDREMSDTGTTSDDKKGATK